MHVCNNAYIALTLFSLRVLHHYVLFCVLLHKIKRECVELTPKINQLKRLTDEVLLH